MLIALLKGFIYIILITYIILYIICKSTFRRCKSKVCLIGKTVIITGGNRGIGLATSLNLASRGCRLIIACRSTNSEEIKQKLIKETHNPNIIIKYLDLTSFGSVRNFAREINETETRLDILINNAGIAASSNKHTEDNLNIVMQTNYFGPFLLTHLLADLMKRTPKSRIVFVSSVMSYFHNVTMEKLNIPENNSVNIWNFAELYSNSKFCQIISMKIFAEKLLQFGITSVNAVHPGLIDTEIFQSMNEHLFIQFFYLVFKIVMKTPEQGAQPILTAAISNEYEKVTGKFIWDFQYTPTHGLVINEQFCWKIWEATENYVKLEPHKKL